MFGPPRQGPSRYSTTGHVPIDNRRYWVMGSPGTLADGYGRRHSRWWPPWLEHNLEPWAPKTPVPLEDQPLTSAAGATRATHNLCMDEGGWWIWLDRRLPAYGNSNRGDDALWGLSSLSTHRLQHDPPRQYPPAWSWHEQPNRPQQAHTWPRWDHNRTMTTPIPMPQRPTGRLHNPNPTFLTLRLPSDS